MKVCFLHLIIVPIISSFGCSEPKSSSENKSTLSSSSIEQKLENEEGDLSHDRERITMEELMEFAKQHELLHPEVSEISILALSEYSGHEGNCVFFSKAESYICVDQLSIYVDVQLDEVEWPHIRIRNPVIPGPILTSGTPFWGGGDCGTGVTRHIVPDHWGIPGQLANLQPACQEHDQCYEQQRGVLLC